MSTEIPKNFERVFFSSRPRLGHIAVNIALAPALLYLFQIWSLPPTVVHMLLFAISTFFAARYTITWWNRPRLIISNEGIWFGTLYPVANITSVEPLLRNIKLRIATEQGEQEKMIGLGWAKNDEIDEIFRLAQSLKSQESEKSLDASIVE